MSDAFITRRGGGGGLSMLGAVLHVSAPVGSTITLSKGGVMVKVLDAAKGHTNAENDTLADWYYSVSPSNYGEWTVTAAKDGESASQPITVDSNKQYDVSIAKKTIIDVNTMTINELQEITRTLGNAYAPKLSNDLFFFETNGNTGAAAWQINKLIDVTNYDYLVYSGYRYGSTSDYYGFGFGDSNTAQAANICNIASKNVEGTTLDDTVLDISGISGSYYFGIRRYSKNTSPHVGMYAEKVYMTNFL